MSARETVWRSYRQWGVAKMKPILIIGGGVVGLSIGWHLARAGENVLILDKGSAGCEASSAAAGMITPVSEIRFGEEELLALFLESLHLYPGFISSLEKSSGTDTDFNQNGSMMVAIDHDDEAELERLFDYQKTLGLPVSKLSSREISEREPLLNPNCAAALEAKGEFFVDNRKLVTALREAFIKAGGHLAEHKEVSEVVTQEKKTTGVVVNGEVIEASHVVLASGIHTKFIIPGLPIIPIRPIKGQALEVKNTGSQKLSRAVRTIHRYPAYLVPRSDGRIIIGATSEEMGLDARVTAGAVLELLYGASKIMPCVDDMTLLGTWCGHRAASPDHAPILGETGIEGLSVAMGMYRHGILLAPVVGKIMADLICGKKPSPFLQTFSCLRFNNK